MSSDKKQLFRDELDAQLVLKQFNGDLEERRDFFLEQIQNRTQDILSKGILTGLVASGSGTSNLNISIGNFLIEGIRINLPSIHTESVSALGDNTYYLYVTYVETRKNTVYIQDPANTNHPYIEYEPDFELTTNSGITDRIKVCSIVVASNVISSINTTFRDIAKITPANSALNDTITTDSNLWSAQKIANEIVTRIANIDEDPIIAIANDPPVSPNDYDRYIVGDTPTGDWAGASNYIAQWGDETSSWLIILPREGTTIFNQDTNYYLTYNGSAWVRTESNFNLDEITDGTTYKKMTATQQTDLNTLSGGGATTLHKHSLANQDGQVSKSQINLTTFSPTRDHTIVIAASDSVDTTAADYVCDGVDDQAEINAAIAGLPAGGGEIKLLEGTYNITGGLVILRSNVKLTGCGEGTTIYRNTTAGMNMIDIRGYYNEVSYMTFDANGNTNTPQCIHIDGDGASKGQNVILCCKCYNSAYGIYINDSPSNTIQNNDIVACSTEGIRVNGQYNNINNNIISTCNVGIILAYVGKGFNVVSENIISYCSSYGIHISASETNIISNNVTTNCTLHGIYSYNTDGLGPRNSMFLGNVSCDNTQYGIWVHDVGVPGSKVNSNVCTGNTLGNIVIGGNVTKADNIE